MVIIIGVILWALLGYGLLLWIRAATWKGDDDERTDIPAEREDSGNEHGEHKPTP